jgi:tetratricopeptide (TPR) repeat protein
MNFKQYKQLGDELSKQERWREAATAYRKAIEIKPKWSNLYYLLAQVLEKQRDLEEATANYQRAVEINPTVFRHHKSLGDILAKQKRFAEAINAYQQAIQLQPENPNIYYLLGISQEEQGNLQEAIENYKQAISLEPKGFQFHRSLGNILSKSAEELLSEASLAYQNALQIQPNNQEIRRLVLTTKSLRENIEDSENKVDVAINVYGKPYQTYITLLSLWKHSGQHINKIFFIEERSQPFNAQFEMIYQRFEGKLEIYVPSSQIFNHFFKPDMVRKNYYRISLRYQYAWEKSLNQYLFITHNDVLYHDDIIGTMLKEIQPNYVGIGQIGQCWNCPAKVAKICNSHNYMDLNLSYEEAVDLTEKYSPLARKEQALQLIDKNNPIPLPECRLNEFACLIDRKTTMNDIMPRGSVPPFGAYSGIDLACGWFKGLSLLGYKFKHFEISKFCTHGWIEGAGASSKLRRASLEGKSEEYERRENIAKVKVREFDDILI